MTIDYLDRQGRGKLEHSEAERHAAALPTGSLAPTSVRPPQTQPQGPFRAP